MPWQFAERGGADGQVGRRAAAVVFPFAVLLAANAPFLAVMLGGEPDAAFLDGTHSYNDARGRGAARTT